MNSEDESLEGVLRHLKPRELSAGMIRQLFERLDATANRPPIFTGWRLALGVGVTAAALTFVLSRRPVENQFVPVQAASPDAKIQKPEDLLISQPHLAVYQFAFAESPEAFDRLLAQHARTFGGSDVNSADDLCDRILIGVP